jgi:hypothetical protein
MAAPRRPTTRADKERKSSTARRFGETAAELPFEGELLAGLLRCRLRVFRSPVPAQQLRQILRKRRAR